MLETNLESKHVQDICSLFSSKPHLQEELGFELFGLLLPVLTFASILDVSTLEQIKCAKSAELLLNEICKYASPRDLILAICELLSNDFADHSGYHATLVSKNYIYLNINFYIHTYSL